MPGHQIVSKTSFLGWLDRLESLGLSDVPLSRQTSFAHLLVPSPVLRARGLLPGHLDQEATGLTLGRHSTGRCLSRLRSWQGGELSHSQEPENGSWTEQVPLPLEQGVAVSSPAVSVFFIFNIFPGSALLPRAPQCPWTWPSTVLGQGCPGLTSVTPGSPGPGSQPQLPDPLLAFSQEASPEPTGCCRGWHGAGTEPGSQSPRAARTSPCGSPSPSCTLLHSASQTTPPPPASEENNWRDDVHPPRRGLARVSSGV